IGGLDANQINLKGAGGSVSQIPNIPASSSGTITAASWAAGTVTITVASAPLLGYAVGQSVKISGMTPSGYNGTFTINSVVSATSFTSTLATDPGTATAFGTVTNAAVGTDPQLYFTSVQAGAGQTATVTLRLKVTDPNGFYLAAIDTAIAWNTSVFTVSNVR